MQEKRITGHLSHSSPDVITPDIVIMTHFESLASISASVSLSQALFLVNRRIDHLKCSDMKAKLCYKMHKTAHIQPVTYC